MNIVNFVNMWKTDKFTAYLQESKGPVNIVNISQEYLQSMVASAKACGEKCSGITFVWALWR